MSSNLVYTAFPQSSRHVFEHPCITFHFFISKLYCLFHSGRKPGGGTSAFRAEGEEERCRDGRGGILAERAADRAGERAAAPATAIRAAGRCTRLRGQAFRVSSTHSGELAITEKLPDSTWMLFYCSLQQRISFYEK